MAEQRDTREEKKDDQPKVNPFDQMMFGDRIKNRPSHEPHNKEKEDENDGFDLISTTQTVVETYKQLSPYVKNLSNMVKKFKS